MDASLFEANRQQKHKKIVYIVGFTAALAGLLFGMDIGVISGALSLIKAEFHLTHYQEEWVVSSVLLGAFLGTLVAMPISKNFGRRSAILVSALVFCIFSALSASANNVDTLIIYRILLGFGLGIASYTAPLYLSEVAPKRIRGGLIALYQLMITIGILCAFISDSLFTMLESWRWMLGVISIPSFLMFLAVLALPKSPRWLMLMGEKQHAKRVLGILRHRHEVDPEFHEIEKTAQSSTSFSSLLNHQTFKRVIWLGLLLQFMQQVSGMNAALYYAPIIFKLAGYTSIHDQMVGTILVGVINVITTIFAILFVDRFGRRPVLFVGCTCMILGFFTLGLMYYIGMSNEVLQHIGIIGLFVFIFGFAIALGPVVWILCSEIFPLKGRDAGITITTATNWAANWLVGISFLTLINLFGGSGTFWIYAVINLAIMIFIFFFVPETKGVSLEQIEANVLSGKKLREIGR